MKPLHVGLLVIGAALAGGLAVKMSQPPVYRSALTAATHVVKPSVQKSPAQEVAQALAPASPSPALTVAPPPIYEEEPPKPARARAAPKPLRRTQAAPPTPQMPRNVELAAKTEVHPPAPLPYQAPVAPPPDQTAAAEPPVVDTVASSAPARTPPPVSAPAPAQVTLNQGAQIAVRLDQAISSDNLSPGDTFQASLAEPLVADGYIIAERGAHVSGRIVDTRRAGRLSGRSELQLSLSSFETADGQKIAISTEPWVQQGDSSRGREAAKIGGGAALGAIIGAIAGGGMGAAIGAGVGGAAGTGVAAATRGKAAGVASEAVIHFKLASRVTITERQL